MAFAARLFIQGVGINRLSDDGASLDAFFPTNRAATDFGLLDASGRPVNDVLGGHPPICEHFAFIQFSARNLDPANQDIWMTVMLDRERVDVVAGGAGVLPLQVGPGGRVVDMASIQDLLAGEVADPRQLRTDLDDRRGELLHAEVHVRNGHAAGFMPRRWTMRNVESRLSGAVEVQLGNVDSLGIRITSFEGEPSRVLSLRGKPPANDCEVWIRHFCNFVRPDPHAPVLLQQGDLDADFILNYSLLEGIRTLADDRRQRLPIPVITAGGQIGGNHAICMGAAS